MSPCWRVPFSVISASKSTPYWVGSPQPLVPAPQVQEARGAEDFRFLHRPRERYPKGAPPFVSHECEESGIYKAQVVMDEQRMKTLRENGLGVAARGGT